MAAMTSLAERASRLVSGWKADDCSRCSRASLEVWHTINSAHATRSIVSLTEVDDSTSSNCSTPPSVVSCSASSGSCASASSADAMWRVRSWSGMKPRIAAESGVVVVAVAEPVAVVSEVVSDSSSSRRAAVLHERRCARTRRLACLPAIAASALAAKARNCGVSYGAGRCSSRVKSSIPPRRATACTAYACVEFSSATSTWHASSRSGTVLAEVAISTSTGSACRRTNALPSRSTAAWPRMACSALMRSLALRLDSACVTMACIVGRSLSAIDHSGSGSSSSSSKASTATLHARGGSVSLVPVSTASATGSCSCLTVGGACLTVGGACLTVDGSCLMVGCGSCGVGSICCVNHSSSSLQRLLPATIREAASCSCTVAPPA